MESMESSDQWGSPDERSQAEGAAGSPPREIVVIDDDPGIVSLLIALLRDEEHFAVRAAYSVQQLLAGPPADAPALVLLDLSMPWMRPDDLVATLRQRPNWEHVPIVLCSGQADLATQARRLNATGYLAKPFNLDAVVVLAHRFASPALGQSDPGRSASCYSDEQAPPHQ